MKLHEKGVCNGALDEEEKSKHSKPRVKEQKKNVIEPIVPISYYSTSGQHTSGRGEIVSSPTPSSSPPPQLLPRHHRRPPRPALAMPSPRTKLEHSTCYYRTTQLQWRRAKEGNGPVVARAPDALGLQPLFITHTAHSLDALLFL